MIRPLFSWLAGRHRTDEPSTAAPADPAGSAGATGAVLSGIEAGRREVQALEALRHVRFDSREEAALHTQLARAPRDIGALFGLLQFHVRRGDAKQAESFAHALWDETDAEGALWHRAAALCRSIDPDNPLYSDDPFTALAQHAAAQPSATYAPLPLSAFDLSLPHTGSLDPAPHGLPDFGGDLGEFGTFGVDSTADDARTDDVDGSRSAGRPEDADGSTGASRGEAGAACTGPHPDPRRSVFDYLNAPPSEQLPTSFAGLTLDLDDLPPGDALDAEQAAARTLSLFSGRSALAVADASEHSARSVSSDAAASLPISEPISAPVGSQMSASSGAPGSVSGAAVIPALSPVRMKYTKYGPVRRSRGRKKSRK